MQVIAVVGSPHLRAIVAQGLGGAAAVPFAEYPSLDAVPDAAAATCDVLILPGHLPFPDAAFARWPALLALVSPFTGVEGIDVAAATSRGVLVANGQSRENCESLAEATILLILAASYDLASVEAVLRRDAPRPAGPRRMLGGKRVGLIGFGAVAQAVAARLAAFGVELVVHTRTPPVSPPPGVHFLGLDALLAGSDVVVMLAGLNAANHHMLDAARLAAMKPDAVFVNVARGGLVDEAALTRLLAERPRMRAALDVFEVEPLPADSPLRDLPNVVLTPHMLSHTDESSASLPLLLGANVRAVLAGDAPPSLFNPAALPAWRDRRARYEELAP